MEKAKIILVDDEILIRKGIRFILEQEDNFEIIEEFENGLEFIKHIESSTTLPDIVLMDIKMPETNGIVATKQLMHKYPNLKIIALSSYNSEIFIANMFEVGAVCYITKSTPVEEMIRQINIVLQNGFFYEDSVIRYLVNHTNKQNNFFDKHFITERELDVLKLICEQKSATEIATILKISPRTVDGHRNNLLLKTESKNIVGLVLFAIENSYFIPEIN